MVRSNLAKYDAHQQAQDGTHHTRHVQKSGQHTRLAQEQVYFRFLHEPATMVQRPIYPVVGYNHLDISMVQCKENIYGFRILGYQTPASWIILEL